MLEQAMYTDYTIRAYDNGDVHWYKNDALHRKNGPAIEYASGNKEWYWEGFLHREDGPAIDYIDGTQEWWLHGNRYLERVWRQMIGE